MDKKERQKFTIMGPSKVTQNTSKIQPPSKIIDGQTKKIKSKDDITWIKPETKKSNQSAAKCAQNKEKTLDLIKLHKNKLKMP